MRLGEVRGVRCGWDIYQEKTAKIERSAENLSQSERRERESASSFTGCPGPDAPAITDTDNYS
jgi:hypothetical protein